MQPVLAELESLLVIPDTIGEVQQVPFCLLRVFFIL